MEWKKEENELKLNRKSEKESQQQELEPIGDGFLLDKIDYSVWQREGDQIVRADIDLDELISEQSSIEGEK